MKIYLLCILIFIVTPVFSGTSDELKSFDATVEIQNAIINGGAIYVMCFNSEESLNNEKYFRIVLKTKISKSTFNIKFNNLPAGDYVFIAFQDINDNGDLDEDVLKIPEEPFAVSNYNDDMDQELNFKKLKNTFSGKPAILTSLKLMHF